MLPQESCYVYMVRCENGSLYTGWTNDLLKRLNSHATAKGARYTKAFGASHLAYAEVLPSRGEALRREAQLKALSKAEKEALAAGFEPEKLVMLRLATRKDAEGIQRIFSHYVQHSTASFLYQPPTVEQYQKELTHLLKTLPFFVAENGTGQLVGYACAHGWRYASGAYAWDVETTIYLAPEARKSGIGSKLYHALLGALALQGYWNAYAVLADPNPASEAFHEAFGFVCEGRQARTGWKNGWQGISYWLMDLHPGTEEPERLPQPLTKQQLNQLAAAAQQGADWKQMGEEYTSSVSLTQG